LNNLKNFQNLKQQVLTQEAARLTLKNSADPKISDINARISYNELLVPNVDQQIAKASVTPDPLPASSWRVYGTVYDPNNSPEIGVTVFFSDENNLWLKELGNTCTDQTGYYSITVAANLLKDIIARGAVYISVSDEKQQLSYQDPTPLVVAKGLIDLKNIYVEINTCAPPPDPNQDSGTKPTKTKG
jgi:hypothetical protein